MRGNFFSNGSLQKRIARNIRIVLFVFVFFFFTISHSNAGTETTTRTNLKKFYPALCLFKGTSKRIMWEKVQITVHVVHKFVRHRRTSGQHNATEQQAPKATQPFLPQSKHNGVLLQATLAYSKSHLQITLSVLFSSMFSALVSAMMEFQDA